MRNLGSAHKIEMKLSIFKMAYKMKTYEQLEDEIDLCCIFFASAFCLIYVAILLPGIVFAMYGLAPTTP